MSISTRRIRFPSRAPIQPKVAATTLLPTPPLPARMSTRLERTSSRVTGGLARTGWPGGLEGEGAEEKSCNGLPKKKLAALQQAEEAGSPMGSRPPMSAQGEGSGVGKPFFESDHLLFEVLDLFLDLVESAQMEKEIPDAVVDSLLEKIEGLLGGRNPIPQKTGPFLPRIPGAVMILEICSSASDFMMAMDSFPFWSRSRRDSPPCSRSPRNRERGRKLLRLFSCSSMICVNVTLVRSSWVLLSTTLTSSPRRIMREISSKVTYRLSRVS